VSRILTAVFRAMGKIPGACCWLWEVITLQSAEVPSERAQAHLAALRKLLVWILVPDLVFGGILLGYRWPTAKARALRILVERQAVQCDLAVLMYGQAISEVTNLAFGLCQPEALALPHGQDKLFAMDLVRSGLEDNKQAMLMAQTTAHQAQAALPDRIWGSTPWRDPLSGMSFPANASREEIAAGLLHHLLRSKEQQGWLLAVSRASRPSVPEQAPAGQSSIGTTAIPDQSLR